MEERNQHGFGIHTRRIIAYIVLIIVTIMCLFWFYVLFINATRSKAALKTGFTLIPGGNFIHNFKNAFTDSSIQIPRGMINSFIVAAGSAICTTYFSALTAYGIYVYNFKLKKYYRKPHNNPPIQKILKNTYSIFIH